MKKIQRKWGKRGLTLLVVLSMCLSTLSLTALADNDTLEDLTNSAAGDIEEAVENFLESVENGFTDGTGTIDGIVDSYVDQDDQSGLGDEVRGALAPALNGTEEKDGAKKDIGDAIDDLETAITDALDTIENAAAGLDGAASNSAFTDAYTKANDVLTSGNAAADKYGEAANTAAGVETEVGVAEAQAQELVDSVKGLMDEVNGTLEDAMDQVGSFVEAVQSVAGNERRSQADIDALTDQIESLEQTVKESGDKVTAAEKAYEDAQATVEELQKKLTELKSSVSNAQSGLDKAREDLNGTIDELLDQLGIASKALEDAKTALATAQDAYEAAKNFQSLAESVMEKLKANSNSATEGGQKALEDELDELLRLAVAEAEAQLAKKQAHSDYDAELGKQQDFDALDADITDLENLTGAYDAQKEVNEKWAALEKEKALADVVGAEGFVYPEEYIKAQKEVEAVNQVVEKLKDVLEGELGQAKGLNPEKVDKVLTYLKTHGLASGGSQRSTITSALGNGARLWGTYGNGDSAYDALSDSLLGLMQDFYDNHDGTNYGMDRIVNDLQQGPLSNKTAEAAADALKDALGDDYKNMSADEIKQAANGADVEAAQKAYNEALAKLQAYPEEYQEAQKQLSETEYAVKKQALAGKQATKDGQAEERAAVESKLAELKKLIEGTVDEDGKEIKGADSLYNDAKAAREESIRKLKALFGATDETAGTLLDLILAQAAFEATQKALDEDKTSTGEEAGGNLWANAAKLIEDQLEAFAAAQTKAKQAEADYNKAKARVDAVKAKLDELKAKERNVETTAQLERLLETAIEDLEAKAEALKEAREKQTTAEGNLTIASNMARGLQAYIPPTGGNGGGFGGGFGGGEAEVPEVNAPEANQPEANQPEANQPEANQPEANQPEANQPEANQPEGGVNGGNGANGGNGGNGANGANGAGAAANGAGAAANGANAPAANVPGADDALVNIPDAGVPLAGANGAGASGADASDAEDGALVDIADEDVPLAGFTAEEAESRGMLWIVLAVVGFSGVGAAAWLTLRKKTRA